jgi:hypothetical protein
MGLADLRAKFFGRWVPSQFRYMYFQPRLHSKLLSGKGTLIIVPVLLLPHSSGFGVLHLRKTASANLHCL